MLSEKDKEIVNKAKSIRFTIVNKNTVLLHKDKHKVVALKVGQTYTCNILNPSENKMYSYEVFLTNIEFRKFLGVKRLFSVSVDMFRDNNLFKSDVFFYNLSFIKDRATRFPIKKDTIANNYGFWSTLTHNDFSKQHSDIQFYRMALDKGTRGKECRINLRKTRKNHASLFEKLDKIKNNMSLPNICFKVDASDDENNNVVTVYGVSKNAPLKLLAGFKVGDKINGSTIEKIEANKIVIRLDKTNQEIEISYDSINDKNIGKRGDLDFWMTHKNVQDFLKPRSF